MKKAIASGLIGLIALGGTAAVALPDSSAQVPDDEARQERQLEREARRAEKVEALTSVLGISADELQAAREAGQSVADIAAAEGVELQTVIDALVANAQARLDAKIAAGEVDADRAAEISDGIEERVTARVNGERTEGRRGHHGPRGDAASTAELGA